MPFLETVWKCVIGPDSSGLKVVFPARTRRAGMLFLAKFSGCLNWLKFVPYTLFNSSINALRFGYCFLKNSIRSFACLLPPNFFILRKYLQAVL